MNFPTGIRLGCKHIRYVAVATYSKANEKTRNVFFLQTSFLKSNSALFYYEEPNATNTNLQKKRETVNLGLLYTFEMPYTFKAPP